MHSDDAGRPVCDCQGFVAAGPTLNELLALKRRLGKYNCQCGSGGPMACDDDCPGDTTDSTVKEVLTALVDAEIARLHAKLP